MTGLSKTLCGLNGRACLALSLAALWGCSSSSGSGATAAAATYAHVCDLPTLSGVDCDQIHSLALPSALPPSRGNQYGDNMQAGTLGFHLFFSSALGHGVSCPTCHLPELAFTDRKSVSMGQSLGTRNAPTVFNAARLSVIFWDGRADSVWSQPLFAIENPIEMNSTRTEAAQLVASDTSLRGDYEAVFGPLPDMSSWPAAGKPGDPAFDALSPDVQDQINRIAANIGKAIEAYERLNSTAAAALDHFLAEDQTQMIPAAQRGLKLFLTSGCSGCHSGPLLSDESFHDVGFPSLPGAAPDMGRAGGLPVLEANIFNLSGPYADPGPGVPPPANTETPMVGAFRTPSLRNVTRTAPYGHDGAIDTLENVLLQHAPMITSEDDRGDLLAFFEDLNGDYPPRPWNTWPSPQ